MPLVDSLEVNSNMMIHIVCNYCVPPDMPGIALCGKEIKGISLPLDTAECVVCIDLLDEPCNTCV